MADISRAMSRGVSCAESRYLEFPFSSCVILQYCPLSPLRFIRSVVPNVSFVTTFAGVFI